ncbi:MAG TPA: H-NS histone family protein [Nevskiaceae bacterium]|nr:H-NS histone family protein [Nevskiaceae bacterium]
MDISHLSLDDLRNLQKQVAETVVERQKQARVEVKKQIRALAEKNGTTLEELFGIRLRRERSGKAQPKYRNPVNKNEVWSGRGRTPRWMQEQIKHGAKKTDFLIK